MPVLSGVSGNALAFALALAFGTGGWGVADGEVIAPSADAATSEFTLHTDGGGLRISGDPDRPSTCGAKCLANSVTLSRYGNGPDFDDLTDFDASGLDLVVTRGSDGLGASFAAPDDPDHFAATDGELVHVGGADVHCRFTDDEELIDFLAAPLSLQEATQMETRLTSRVGGLDGLGARLQATGRAGNVGLERADATYLCTTYGPGVDDVRAETVAVVRDADRLLDRTITGSVVVLRGE